MENGKPPRPRRLRIALAIEEAAGLRILTALARRTDVEICYVLSSAGGAIEKKAKALELSFHPPHLVKEAKFASVLREANIELFLNAHSLYLINHAVLEAASIGSFNLHPSPLPAYAGLNAVSWAIWNEEREHGVTLHWMVPKVDAGDIAYQGRFAITPSETALSLSGKCVREGMQLIAALIDDALVGRAKVPQLKQSLANRSYYKGASHPREVAIDWARPALEIERIIRACSYFPSTSPWGLASSILEGKPLGIIRAAASTLQADQAPGTVRPADEMSVLVACGDTWLTLEHVFFDGAAAQAPVVLQSGMLLGIQ